MTTYEDQVIKSQKQLDRITRALSEFEIAKFLVDEVGQEAVGEALRRIEEKERATIAGAVHVVRHENLADDEHNEFAARNPAMKRVVGKNTPIVLMKNKTKTRFNGMTKSFNDTVDAPHRAFNRIANETDYAIASIKARTILEVAAAKTKERRRIADGQRKGVERVENIVNRRHEMDEMLSDFNSTKAAKTIKTHALPSNAELISAALPSDFRPKTKLVDEYREAQDRVKTGRMNSWTAAAKTRIDKPNHEASPLDDDPTDLYDVNQNLPQVDGLAQTRVPQPNVKWPRNGKSIGAQTQKTHANQEPLGFTRKDIDYDSIESGR